ncbi:MAG: hypothetical protein ACTHKQ_17900 [Mesorhizobium sp.]
MQADKIPDEIMREAARLLDRTHWDRSPTVERVARALMARDKRAAEIARECFDDPQAEADRNYIAAAILTYGGRDERR